MCPEFAHHCPFVHNTTMCLCRACSVYFRSMHRSSTHRDEMDLTAFANFVLAWDQRSHPTAIKYLFPVLDLKNQGFETPAEIYTFFKEIHVKPKTATLITAEDLETPAALQPGAVPILLPGWVDEGGRTSSTKRNAEGQAQGHQVAQVRYHSTLVLKVLT
ncbi:hypothetical protein V8C86DRAFT_3144325 [Haematococcus lacustris]